MASPYPPQMQPQGPITGGVPAAAVAPPVVRRGTSKAVPVVVSAGLAVGVFCGLLFGLGTGDTEASTSSSSSSSSSSTTTASNDKKKDDQKVAEPFQDKKKDPPKKDEPKKEEPKKDEVAAGSGSGSAEKAVDAAGSGSGSDAKPDDKTAKTDDKTAKPDDKTAKPDDKTAKPDDKAPKGTLTGTLTVEISPESAAKSARITVDGKSVSGNVYAFDLKGLKPENAERGDVKRDVRVVVRASGYSTVEKPMRLIAVPNADNNQKLVIEMQKRSSSPVPTGTTNTPTHTTKPPPPKPKCKKPPCNLIDI